VSLEDLGIKTGNSKAKILAKTLDAATGKLLDNNKSPSPRTGELDNRGSQFYLALYWAQALAAQTETRTARTSRRWPRTLAANEQRSSTNSRRCKDSRPTSAATTCPIRRRPRPSCAERHLQRGAGLPRRLSEHARRPLDQVGATVQARFGGPFFVAAAVISRKEWRVPASAFRARRPAHALHFPGQPSHLVQRGLVPGLERLNFPGEGIGDLGPPMERGVVCRE
jgi:hypothetical protein